MYAILKTGGKQYKVKAGDVIRVEKLPNNLGSEFEMTEVLCVGGDKTFIGEPTVDKASVTVVVTNQSKSPKVIVFKKKRRQGYRRLRGHRQQYTELFVKAITSPDGDVEKASDKPHVFEPEKREERLQKLVEAKAEAKKEKKAAKKKAKAKTQTKKKTAKKKTVAKKAGAKKKTAKKTAAKKKTAKKKTAKKKAAKKKTAKKKTKRS